MKEGQLRKEVLNPMLDKIEETDNKRGVILKEMVTSFLIPEVLRNKEKKYLNELQMKYIQSTKGVIEDSLRGVTRKLGDN